MAVSSIFESSSWISPRTLEGPTARFSKIFPALLPSTLISASNMCAFDNRRMFATGWFPR